MLVVIGDDIDDDDGSLDCVYCDLSSDVAKREARYMPQQLWPSRVSRLKTTERVIMLNIPANFITTW